jgi:hypothetical protein
MEQFGFTLTSEFWSAIAGAIVGGCIAFAVQMYALKENRSQRIEDRLRANQSLARSLLFKLSKMYSDFVSVYAHIDEGLKRVVPNGHNNEPWTSVRPLMNPPEKITFLSEEMSLLLELKDDRLFNSLFSLDRVHGALVEILGDFRVERERLFSQMPSQPLEGGVVQISLNKEQVQALRPRMELVNYLVRTAHEWCEKDSRTASDALDRLQVLVREQLNLKIELLKKTPGSSSRES